MTQQDKELFEELRRINALMKRRGGKDGHHGRMPGQEQRRDGFKHGGAPMPEPFEARAHNGHSRPEHEGRRHPDDQCEGAGQERHWDPHHGNPAGGQNRILLKLRESDGISQRDLTILLGVRPQSAGELIDKLEAAGYVQRRKSEQDKRVVNLFLTEAGRERAAGLAEVIPDNAENFLSPLSETERAQLLELLKKLGTKAPAEEL